MYHAYHFRSMGEDIVSNAERLWTQCVELGNVNNYDIDVLKTLPTRLICYDGDRFNPHELEKAVVDERSAGDKEKRKKLERELDLFHDKGNVSFNFSPKPSSKSDSSDRPTLKGWLDAHRLHDTYLLNLTVSFADKNTTCDPSAISTIAELPLQISSSLGRAFVLTGVADGTPKELQEISDLSAASILGKTVRLSGKGKLFGSPIFEYEASRTYLLVWLSPNPEARKSAVEAFGNDKDKIHIDDFYQLVLCKSKMAYCIDAIKLSREDLLAQKKILDKFVNRQQDFLALSPLNFKKEHDAFIEQLGKYNDSLELLFRGYLDALEINYANYAVFLHIFKHQSLDNNDLSFWENQYEKAILRHYEEKARLLAFNGFLFRFKNFADALSKISPEQHPVDLLWEKTKGWFVDSDGILVKHNPPKKVSTDYQDALAKVFSFALPIDTNTVKNIHESLKCLCGDYFIGSDPTKGNRHLSMGSILILAMLAHQNTCKNIEPFKDIDWENNSLPKPIFLKQKNHRACQLTRSLYDLFKAIFQGSEGAKSITCLNQSLVIELYWSADIVPPGKLHTLAETVEKEFSESSLKIPDVVSQTNEAIISVWRSLAISQEGFGHPFVIYMRGNKLTITGIES